MRDLAQGCRDDLSHRAQRARSRMMLVQQQHLTALAPATLHVDALERETRYWRVNGRNGSQGLGS